jgi:hypothetical protein
MPSRIIFLISVSFLGDCSSSTAARVDVEGESSSELLLDPATGESLFLGTGDAAAEFEGDDEWDRWEGVGGDGHSYGIPRSKLSGYTCTAVIRKFSSL